MYHLLNFQLGNESAVTREWFARIWLSLWARRRPQLYSHRQLPVRRQAAAPSFSSAPAFSTSAASFRWSLRPREKERPGIQRLSACILRAKHHPLPPPKGKGVRTGPKSPFPTLACRDLQTSIHPKHFPLAGNVLSLQQICPVYESRTFYVIPPKNNP